MFSDMNQSTANKTCDISVLDISYKYIYDNFVLLWCKIILPLSYSTTEPFNVIL